MTVDEFIQRLESLKKVDGVTGQTPVVIAASSSPANSDFSLPQHWELAIAEVSYVNDKRVIEDQNVWITERERNDYGVVVSLV